MRRASPFTSLVIAVVVCGCTPTFKTFKFAPGTAIHSVVSLSPSTTEIVTANGTTNTLKGRTASDNYPPGLMKAIPEVASVKPDYEKIKAIAPDLIVYDTSLYSPGDIEKIKALGFRTYPFDALTVADLEKQLFEFADLTGAQSNMSDYIDRIDVALGNAAPKPSPAPKVAIIMPGDGGSPLIAGTKSFEADVFKVVGGEPVGPSSDRFVPVSAEMLISENPDLIVVPTTKATGAHDIQEIVNDPRFKSTNAVKNGHIQAMDEDVVLRKGSRVDHFIEGAYKAVESVGGH